jgi:hypothetical protein
MRSYNSDLQLWEDRSAINASIDPPTPSQSQSQALIFRTPSARSRNRGCKTAIIQDPKPSLPIPPKAQMHANEIPLFLSLSAALKLYLGCQVNEDAIIRANELFHDCLVVYRRVSNLLSVFTY